MRSSRFFSTTANGIKKLYVLEYKYVENIVEKRAPIRGAHLEYANKFVNENILVAGGALVPTFAKGMLLFRTNDIEVVNNFAKNDPYVQKGLVTNFEVSEWSVAVGKV